MNPNHDPHDAQLDRNLRAAGRSISLPDAPTAEQAAGWKRAAPVAPASLGLSEGGTRRRVWRFAGVGMAVAASLAFGVISLWPTGHAPVEAKQIFASFTEKLSSAFRVSFENIVADGVHVDGQVIAVFPEPSGDDSADTTGTGVCAELHVRGDKSAEDFAGGDIDLRFALTPGHEWAYLRLNKLPREVLKEGGPVAAIIYGMTHDGLLLKLDGFLEGKLAGLGEHFDLARAFREANHEVRHAMKNVHTEIHSELKKTAECDASNPENEEAAQIARALQELLPKLFSGGATSEDLQTLGSILEQAAGKVTVTPMSDGTTVLEASEFKADEGDEDTEMIARLVLRIVYRPQVGVERAEVLNVGESNGRVRIELGNASLNDTMFDESRLIDGNRTRVLDLGELMKVFGPMIEQAIHEHEDSDDDDSGDDDDE